VPWSWTWIVVAAGYVLIAMVKNDSLSLAACTRSFSLNLGHAWGRIYFVKKGRIHFRRKISPSPFGGPFGGSSPFGGLEENKSVPFLGVAKLRILRMLGLAPLNIMFGVQVESTLLEVLCLHR